MYLFSKQQVVRNSQLYIPYSMRAALGIHNKAVVDITNVEIDNNNAIQTQLLFSVIRRHQRIDLWKLHIQLRDRPGILSEITSHLSSLNIDIVRSTSGTTKHNTQLLVDIDFDAQHYKSEFDLTVKERQVRPGLWLQELYVQLASILINDVEFGPDGKPRIYITPNHILSDSVSSAHEGMTTEVRGGYIDIPPGVLQHIVSAFEGQYPELCNLKGAARAPRAVLFADSMFHCITVTFFFKNTGYAHARVFAINTIGALSQICTRLYGHNLSILQMYSRNTHASEAMIVDLLLWLPPEHDKDRDDSRLRRFVKAALRGKAIKHLECRVNFPKPFTKNELGIDNRAHTA